MNRCGEKVRGGWGWGQRPEAGKGLLKFLSAVVPQLSKCHRFTQHLRSTCAAGMEALQEQREELSNRRSTRPASLHSLMANRLNYSAAFCSSPTPPRRTFPRHQLH